MLLQFRVGWSHHGRTWGCPGGARHAGEDAIAAALREAGEEASVPADAVRPLATHVLDLGFWWYTTVLASVEAAFEPRISDAESLEVRWVPVDEVDALPLHPGFARSWERIRTWLGHRGALVVDAANVIGSVPDGWWRDRAGAAARLRDRLRILAEHGLDADIVGHGDAARWWPDIVLVVEGKARSIAAGPDSDPVEVVRADRDGDGAIVERIRTAIAAGSDPADLTAVTADRGLASRIDALGARVIGPRVLEGALEAAGVPRTATR